MKASRASDAGYQPRNFPSSSRELPKSSLLSMFSGTHDKIEILQALEAQTTRSSLPLAPSPSYHNILVPPSDKHSPLQHVNISKRTQLTLQSPTRYTTSRIHARPLCPTPQHAPRVTASTIKTSVSQRLPLTYSTITRQSCYTSRSGERNDTRSYLVAEPWHAPATMVGQNQHGRISASLKSSVCGCINMCGIYERVVFAFSLSEDSQRRIRDIYISLSTSQTESCMPS